MMAMLMRNGSGVVVGRASGSQDSVVASAVAGASAVATEDADERRPPAVRTSFGEADGEPKADNGLQRQYIDELHRAAEMDDERAERMVTLVGALTDKIMLRGEMSRFSAAMRFVAFEDFLEAGRIPRFGSKASFVHPLSGCCNHNLCRPYESFDRQSTCFIFVSHRWLSSAQAHPDDGNEMRKHELICEAVQRLQGVCIPLDFHIALWVDFSCVNQDGAPAIELEERMASIIGLCDMLITPVVDLEHEQWEMPFAFVNPIEDYRAAHWREYWGRAWCRVEAFLAAVVPPPMGTGTFQDRSKHFKGGLQKGLADGRRPHVIFGTKELVHDVMPVFLPPMLGVTFSRYDPAQGNLFAEGDRPVIRKLTETARKHVKEMDVGYIGECNERGEPHGKGRCVYEDGNYYQGDWKDGKRSGHGKFTYTWGDTETGVWLDDVAHGHFIQVFADGGRFDGEIRNGKRNGPGHFRYHWGGWLHGEYVDDKKLFGQQLMPDGTLTVLRWKDHESGAYSVVAGEGVKFSADRSEAWRLQDGEEVEEISPEDACAILGRFNYVPLVPPVYKPPPLDGKHASLVPMQAAARIHALQDVAHHPSGRDGDEECDGDEELVGADDAHVHSHSVSLPDLLATAAAAPVAAAAQLPAQLAEAVSGFCGNRLAPKEITKSTSATDVDVASLIKEPSDFAARLRVNVNAAGRSSAGKRGTTPPCISRLPSM